MSANPDAHAAFARQLSVAMQYLGDLEAFCCPPNVLLSEPPPVLNWDHVQQAGAAAHSLRRLREDLELARPARGARS